MNGAEALIATLAAGGVNACFTNPGTSEMHLVAALDRRPEIRCVLGLFEGVVTGAADGYARMTGKPACTLLHLGPGLANGLANLHNAWRANVPMVNLVGEHPASHRMRDSPLVSDIEGIARPYSRWLRTSRSAAELGRDGTEAIQAARMAPGRIATLIVPADAAWGEPGSLGPVPVTLAPALPPAERIERVAGLLRLGLPTAFLLFGSALHGRGLAAAAEIAGATGAKLLCPYPLVRMERGAGRACVERIPYVPEQAKEALKDFRQFMLVGVDVPIAYFASPGRKADLVPAGCRIETLAKSDEDVTGALEALATLLPAENSKPLLEAPARPAVPTGSITLQGLAVAVAALLPDGCIVVDESMTSGRAMLVAAKGAGTHDWLGNPGGSIGIAIPLAVGAAVACPERRVLCLSADGSGMYTVQGLWTMARDGLNVTTVIFANRAYSVLQREFRNMAGGTPGPRAANLFEIGRPDLDWVALAKAMGVPGTRVTSLEAFGQALERGFAAEGPSLIEVPL